MNIKKITCLLISTLFVSGTVTNNINIKSIYGEETIESELGDNQETAVDSEITQEEIQSDETLENSDEEAEENSVINEDDNNKEVKEVEKVEENSEVEEDLEVEEDEQEFIEETNLYGERETGIKTSGFGVGSTVYYTVEDYETLKITSYNDGERYYTEEGGSINPNNDLVVNFKGISSINYENSYVTIGEKSYHVVSQNGDHEGEFKVIISSSILKQLDDGENDIKINISPASGDIGTSDRYSGPTSHTTYRYHVYLLINKESPSQDLVLNEDNAVFKNGEVISLKYSDEEKKQITSVTIPETINNEEVTKIGDSLFEGCTSLRTVKFPNTLTTIGDRVFKDCTSFIIFDCPSSIKTIGKEAFKGSGLTNISIDYDCYDIDYTAFDNCNIDVVTVKGGNESQKNYQNNKLLKIAKNINIIQEGKGYKYYKTNEIGKYGITRIDIPEGTSCVYCNQYSYADYPCLELLVVPNSTSISSQSSLYDNNREYFYSEDGTIKHIYAPVTLIRSYNTLGDREQLTKLINADSKDKYVVNVSDSDFSLENSNVWEAYISNNVKSLPQNAFKNCKELTYISIPYDCKIDKTTFEGCYNLCTVEVSGTSDKEIEAKVKEKIENSILGIGEKVKVASFTDKASDEAILTEDIFNVEDGIITKLNISNEDKAQLKEIEIPDHIDNIEIEGIGNDLFNGCSELTSVTLPDTITSIGSGAFVGCSKLTEIKVPEGVTEIDNAVFSGCTSLSKITLPTNISKIESWAFLNCYNLEEINIPEKVTEIGDMAFYNCQKLVSLELPDNTISLGTYAFASCISLEEVKVPITCTEFDKTTFQEDRNIKSIVINGGTYDEKGYLKQKIEQSVNGKEVGEYIPQEKETIVTYVDGASNAAIDTDYIFNVEDGIVTGIKASDYDREKIQSIKIPETIDGVCITAIGNNVFKGCTALEKVEFPSTLKVIGDASFMQCESLKEIEIPEGVETIENAAFNGCSNLVSIKMPSTLKSMGSYTFTNCYKLKNINIPENIEEIGTMEFYNCWDLEEIVFPDNLKSIKESAFTACVSLKNISIPNSVTNMESGIFEECKNLKSVKLPRNITIISERMFKNCSNLETIEMPHIVTKIGKDAIKGCPNIKSMKMQA